MFNNDEITTTCEKSTTKHASAHTLRLKPLWRQTQTILAQLRCPERVAEVFLLSDPLLPCQIEIHRLIEEALSTLPKYIHRGYTLVVEPFRVSAGRCAVIQDSSGTRICLFESARLRSRSA